MTAQARLPALITAKRVASQARVVADGVFRGIVVYIRVLAKAAVWCGCGCGMVVDFEMKDRVGFSDAGDDAFLALFRGDYSIGICLNEISFQ